MGDRYKPREKETRPRVHTSPDPTSFAKLGGTLSEYERGVTGVSRPPEEVEVVDGVDEKLEVDALWSSSYSQGLASLSDRDTKLGGSG